MITLIGAHSTLFLSGLLALFDACFVRTSPMANGHDKSQKTALPWRGEVMFAAQRFNAWWEGYAFDPDTTRQAISKRMSFASVPVANSAPPREIINSTIWGGGREDPGDASWSLKCARTLGLPLKATVAVLGAGGGAPLADLKAGSRWKLHGFAATRAGQGRFKVTDYQSAMSNFNRAICDGGICFFDLHKERDPTALALFAAELSKPNAPFCFIDFTTYRQWARFERCFDHPLSGTVVTADRLTRTLEGVGFRVTDTTDETRAFLPLVSEGWGRWRKAYDYVDTLTNTKQQAEYLHALSRMARLWAERFEALKSGQLRVTRIQARRLSQN
ncbi:MAG: hypothetical protein AAFR03_09340 [Pseudomonadota bacterium]